MPNISFGYAVGLSIVGFFLSITTVMTSCIMESAKEWVISNK